MNLEDKCIVLQYEDLSTVGIYGYLNKKLDQVKDIYSNEKIDIANIRKNEQNYDFLAMFEFYPPLDITLVQDKVHTSTVIHSLNLKESLCFISDMIEKLDFKDIKIIPEFRYQLNREFLIEKITYETCKDISKYIKRDLEDVFGMVRYLRFLEYKGISGRDRLKIATEKFNIPKDLFR